MSHQLSERQADGLWEVLKGYGTRDSQYQEFMNYFTKDDMCSHWEFRCLSLLGFGGKVYWDGYRLRAGMYIEDTNPERTALLEKINNKLSEFQKEYL